jgi:hypothetical protein
MDSMSDEVRLQIIRTEVDNLMLCIKMQITVQTTIEAYRLYLAKELPEEFISYVESDEFKAMFDGAVKASSEILRNLITFTANMGVVFDVDFNSQLPHDAEGFNKLAADIQTQLSEISAAINEEEND